MAAASTYRAAMISSGKAPILDRRHDRTTDTLGALTRLLESARRKSGFEAVTLADDAGLLVAGAGAASLCDELAAVSPVEARWAANDTIPSLLDVVEGRARLRRLKVNGLEVILCGLGGTRDEDAALDGVAQGCGRILQAAFA
jgi:hypothetical protein